MAIKNKKKKQKKKQNKNKKKKTKKNPQKKKKKKKKKPPQKKKKNTPKKKKKKKKKKKIYFCRVLCNEHFYKVSALSPLWLLRRRCFYIFFRKFSVTVAMAINQIQRFG